MADALDAGSMTTEEWMDLQQADAVMSGQHEGNTVYFVGEFSVTVNNNDIDRAISRAATLGRATGSEVWPMVIGDNIPEPQRARAETEGVAVRQVAEQVAIEGGSALILSTATAPHNRGAVSLAWGWPAAG